MLRNEVLGTQSTDLLRDPTRLSESAMGNFVADIMRAKYPDVDAALTNSGGLRADLLISPPSSGGEAPGEITWGETFAVLPFGNRSALVTVTGEQLTAALLNGVSPVCDPDYCHRQVPAGLGARRHVPLRRHHAEHRQCAACPRRPRRNTDTHRADRQHPHRHQRLHVDRWRRLHGVGGRHRCVAAGSAARHRRRLHQGQLTCQRLSVEGRVVQV